MPQLLRTKAEAIDLEPLTVQIPVTVKLTGLGKTRIYELIQSGDLKTIKVGRFCGAGISAPHLPGFAGLVEQTFAALNLEMTPSEALCL